MNRKDHIKPYLTHREIRLIKLLRVQSEENKQNFAKAVETIHKEMLNKNFENENINSENNE